MAVCTREVAYSRYCGPGLVLFMDCGSAVWWVERSQGEGGREGELVRLFTDGLELGVVEALREPVTVSCAEGGVGVMLPLPLREVVG